MTLPTASKPEHRPPAWLDVGCQSYLLDRPLSGNPMAWPDPVVFIALLPMQRITYTNSDLRNGSGSVGSAGVSVVYSGGKVAGSVLIDPKASKPATVGSGSLNTEGLISAGMNFAPGSPATVAKHIFSPFSMLPMDDGFSRNSGLLPSLLPIRNDRQPSSLPANTPSWPRFAFNLVTVSLKGLIGQHTWCPTTGAMPKVAPAQLSHCGGMDESRIGLSESDSCALEDGTNFAADNLAFGRRTQTNENGSTSRIGDGKRQDCYSTPFADMDGGSSFTSRSWDMFAELGQNDVSQMSGA
ncbi:unnamed protein product [Protopolystoma xenopodis]|uniref:Uncharacterized protein n=1 Tax=Protopolystoma xenopodis TaxID=117903 RepID=A0A3S5AZ86_9PLAT|nr:unnamed protein product [Protopolystoma xenopodis]